MAILSTLIPACVFALTLNPSPTGLALRDVLENKVPTAILR